MTHPSEARKTRTLDIRAVLAAGDDPFAKIMAAVAAVGPGESLRVITPFLPSPLIEKLHSEGFAARPERRHDGSWETTFRREGP